MNVQLYLDSIMVRKVICMGTYKFFTFTVITCLLNIPSCHTYIVLIDKLFSSRTMTIYKQTWTMEYIANLRSQNRLKFNYLYFSKMGYSGTYTYLQEELIFVCSLETLG